MNKVLLLIVFALLSLKVVAQNELDKIEQEDAANAYSAYKKSEEELEQIYNQILVENKDDTVFVNRTKAAQRIWLLFRDAEMAMKFPDPHFIGNRSVRSLCLFHNLKGLTDERIRTLRQWTEGTEDEDVCSGSIPIRPK
jgi:uncharacterized protein YecT (DUF1311 family)